MKQAIYITQDLEELFGDAQESCRIIMFSAPTGCGKTVCAHELLRRYGYDILPADASALDFQEQLAACLGGLPEGSSRKEAILVDNLQLIDDAGRDALVQAVCAYPSMLFVLCGRCPLPGWLAEYELARQELTIEPEDLRLDASCIVDLCHERGVDISPEDAQTLAERAKGYPLMIELAMNEMERIARTQGMHPHFTQEIFESDEVRFFGYMQGSVFAGHPTEERVLVLSVAPFERFDIGLAQTLTGYSNVEGLIRRLQRTTRMFSEDGIGRFRL